MTAARRELESRRDRAARREDGAGLVARSRRHFTVDVSSGDGRCGRFLRWLSALAATFSSYWYWCPSGSAARLMSKAMVGEWKEYRAK